MKQISMEVTPYQKMRVFGGSGRISGIITEDGYNNLIDLMGKALEEMDTGQYESFEKLTLHKEKGCLGTPAGDIQLLISFLGWMVKVLDEKEGSNLPSCQCEDSHIHPCICDDDSTPSKAMGIES